MNLRAKIGISVIGSVAALGLSFSIAQADAVTDRQEAMKQVGDAMKAIAAIAKGEAAFDAAVVKANAEIMAKQFAAAKTMFPDGSETGEKPSRAKPEVWSDKDGFMKLLDDSITGANAVAAVTEESALRPALGALGNNSCKACHEKFRKPKE
ncbi:MAG: cytochrome c [Rhizobiales bacterium]|nr:cytochrome c [Hyphomicrobiales bacterium]